MFYYKLKSDNTIEQFVEFADDEKPKMLGNWLETERPIVNTFYNGIMFADEVDQQAEAEYIARLELENAKQSLIDQVQAHLDNACKERGYDNGFACASYIASSVPKFKAEAEAYVLWRDKVWSYCYEQLALFEAGEREIPTDIIAELPKLEW